jgi:hypothetical protein
VDAGEENGKEEEWLMSKSGSGSERGRGWKGREVAEE